MPDVMAPPVSRLAPSRLEVVLGRSLAICLHPRCAWRSSRRRRYVLVSGYFIAGYAATLMLLAVLAR
jgi:hypothetical protein